MQTSPKRHRLHTKTRHKKPCIACLQESTRRAHGQPHRHRHSSDTSPPPKPPKGIFFCFFCSFVIEGHFEIKQRKKRQGAQQQWQQLAQWDDERSGHAAVPGEQRPLQRAAPSVQLGSRNQNPAVPVARGPVVTPEPFWPSTPSTDRQTHTHVQKIPTAAVWLQPLFPHVKRGSPAARTVPPGTQTRCLLDPTQATAENMGNQIPS